MCCSHVLLERENSVRVLRSKHQDELHVQGDGVADGHKLCCGDAGSGHCLKANSRILHHCWFDPEITQQVVCIKTPSLSKVAAKLQNNTAVCKGASLVCNPN